VNGGADHRYNGGWVHVDSTVDGKVCLHLLARPTEKNTSAETVGGLEVSWSREDEVEQTLDSKTQVLNWLRDQPLTLAQNAKSQILTITLFGEIERVVPATTPSDLIFLSATPDTRNSTLILAPKRLWENAFE
jgi:hypothetical protein